MKWLLFLLLLSSFVFAECLEVTDGMTITESVRMCADTFDVPSGITIAANNIDIDCNSAVLRGSEGSNVGITVKTAQNVSIRKCNLLTFDTGIVFENVKFSTIEDTGLLKNKVGIRMFDSFENLVWRTVDQSRITPVSLTNSKFNVVVLDNREIDEEFCTSNICNKRSDPNPCVSGDFYCSPKCPSDSDCSAPIPSPISDDVEFVPSPLPSNEVVTPPPESDSSIPLWIKISLSLIVYIIALYTLREFR